MLFDQILGKSNIKNYLWKNEINKWLLFVKDKGELERFIPRLTKMDDIKRGEVLAEISSAYVIEKILNYTIVRWEELTKNGKNVDFVLNAKSEEIYCEVKSPSWQSELSKEEKIGVRKTQPKYKNHEVRTFAHWKNIRYAIKKAYPKFLSNCKNLVIISDNLFVGILDFPTDSAIDIALFDDKKVYNDEKGVFVDYDYEKIGGILFININPGSKRGIYKCKFIANPNALKKYNLSI